MSIMKKFLIKVYPDPKNNLKEEEMYVWVSCYKEAMECAWSFFPSRNVDAFDTGERYEYKC